MKAVAPPRLPLAEAWSAAVAATLARPLAWAFGLLGFLAGGGFVLVAWPMLVLPTMTGLQTMLGGPVTTIVFGISTVGLVLLVVGAAAGSLAVIVAAVVIGAWAEHHGIAVALDAAAEEGVPRPRRAAGAPRTLRVAAVRLLALGPVALVAAASAKQVYDVVYRELVLPGDLAIALPIRVVAALPLQAGLLLLAWLLSDAAAAIGVRLLVIEQRSVAASWMLGWAAVIRRPLRVLATAIGGVVLVAMVVGPALVATGIGWTHLRGVLAGDRGPALVLAAAVVWVATWLGSLVLAGVATGIRAAAWTMIALGREAD